MTALPANDVVLLGIGHTSAHVLRMRRREPVRGARLTCISNQPVATYSGMLPGVLAGQYPPERMEIDLVRLTAAAGARLIVDEVTGLDPARQELLFETRSPVRFDVLSVAIGSVPGWTTGASRCGRRLGADDVTWARLRGAPAEVLTASDRPAAGSRPLTIHAVWNLREV